ncbi:MAG: sugar transferase [Deltaproteobacteria bacterium]
MLKQQVKTLRYFAMTVDAAMVVAAFFVSDHCRYALGMNGDHRNSYWLLFLVLPAWYFLFDHFHLYSSMRIRSIPAILSAIFRVHLVGAVFVSSMIFILSLQGYRREVFVLFMVTSFLFLCIERIAVKYSLLSLRRRGWNVRNLLVVPGDAQSERLVGMIEAHADWGLKIAGFLSDGEADSSRRIGAYPVLGKIREIADVCMKLPVDEVIFCLPEEQSWVAEKYRTLLRNMGITVRVVLDHLSSPPDRSEVGYFHKEILMLTYYAKPFDAGRLFAKRSIDIAGAVAGLLFTAVLFPFLAAAIMCDSPGPLFFRQRRVGMNGRPFTIRKFRSMYCDAEERKAALLALNEMEGAMFKMRDDPRVTRVGRFLRRTSLDELPQFWNVLLGEMSLVGTRPPTPEEVAEYSYEHRKRICIKPGLTGLWQVSGRNRVRNFDEVVRLDIEYIDKWTLWMDARILLKTFRVWITREGAC